MIEGNYTPRIEFVAVAHMGEDDASVLLGVFGTDDAARAVAEKWLVSSGGSHEVSISEVEFGKAYLHHDAPKTKRYAVRTQLFEVPA